MANWSKPIKGTIKVPKGGGYNVSNGTRYHAPLDKGSGKSSFASKEMQKVALLVAAIPTALVATVVGYFVYMAVS